jgi:SPP1 family predicted phage head-tail adaptor
MFDEAIYLRTETETTDKYGDPEKTITERQVFAQVKSISQTEFYQAQAIGLRPEIKFVIADFYDYQGEQTLKYTPFGGTPQIYEVIRTYRTKTNLEIVCRRGIE